MFGWLKRKMTAAKAPVTSDDGVSSWLPVWIATSASSPDVSHTDAGSSHCDAGHSGGFDGGSCDGGGGHGL